MVATPEELSENLAKRTPASVRAVMAQLQQAGYEAFIVGGCVRDALLGREPHDWDMTTNATPDQMKQAISYHSIDTGLKHGTITFVVDHEPIDLWGCKGICVIEIHPWGTVVGASDYPTAKTTLLIFK